MIDLETNLKKLERYSAYGKNWNNYGAERFSKELIDKVRDILYELNSQPFVSPLPYNAIQIEWEKENGEYLELEISEEEKLKCFYMSSDGKSKEYEISKSAEAINNEFNKFNSGTF